MTLAVLIYKARCVGNGFNTYDIPLKYEGRDVDVEFELEGNNKDGYIINMIIK